MSAAFLLEIAFWLVVLVLPLALYMARIQRQSLLDEAEAKRRDVEKSPWS